MADVEKGLPSPVQVALSNKSLPENWIDRLNARFTSLKFVESRGIERVPAEERMKSAAWGDLMQMFLLWFSVNITANNIAVGMLGPLDYSLSFVDSALCGTFGALLGAAGVAYMGTFGPVSGNRTMVVARFLMGYWPSKLCALLNIVIMLGYGMVDCVVGGQILSAVSGGGMTVVVGIIIVAIITWLVVLFGMSIFNVYERWAWAPQLIAAFILVGCAGPKFDTSIASTGDPETIAGNRLSFFSLCLSASVAWAPAGADFYVYFPENTPKWKTFLMTFLGVGLSLTFANLLGVGLASGTFTNTAWSDANDVSSGALVVAGFDGLGGFGKFMSVLVALGLIGNNIPGTYSASLGFQMLGRYAARLPRWFWSCVGVIIYTVCALAGRNHLYDIFSDWLSLMGYWVCIYLVIALEEQFIFRWTSGFVWEDWADPSNLPIGIAALSAFLIGWAGSIVTMDQIYYVGPIAAMVGDDGSDLGIWVGSAWAMLVFPPLRWLELKYMKR